MSIHLIRKIERFTQLSVEDKAALQALAARDVRRLAPKSDLIREGEAPRQVNLVLDGWACRYKDLEDGRRQITGFLVPGDICDMRIFILKRMDHSIGAVGFLKVADIPTDVLIDVVDAHPRVGRALWWSSLVEEATSREWTTSLGQRDALERLAHLFCELFFRLKAVGLTNGAEKGQSFDLPVTQDQLAAATGMSLVHMSRTLQTMREEGLIVLRSRTLTIPDLEVLRGVAMFNANYLHFDREGQEFDANER